MAVAAAPESRGASIEIEALAKHFGSVRAVDNVSLSISAGDFWGRADQANPPS
jgi:ABC-type sugar transport system ATPase subunit